MAGAHFLHNGLNVSLEFFVGRGESVLLRLEQKERGGESHHRISQDCARTSLDEIARTRLRRDLLGDDARYFRATRRRGDRNGEKRAVFTENSPHMREFFPCKPDFLGH